MALRLTEEQSRTMGIPHHGRPSSGKYSKREKIKRYLQKIEQARCTVLPQEKGVVVEITGIGIPSLNAMLGWDQKGL